MRVLLLFILSLSACVKNNEGINVNSSLEFTLRGTRIVCDVNKSASVIGSTIKLEGSWTNGGSILLNVWSTAPGTYVFSGSECHNAVLWQNSQPKVSGRVCTITGSSPLLGPGSVTIANVTNDYVSGSFEFITEGPDRDTVTNGIFNLKREN